MISLGTNVNIPGSKYPSDDSITALSIAVESGQIDMVELLLKAGADINVAYLPFSFKIRGSRLSAVYTTGRRSWSTPLHVAATLGHVQIVTLLLDYSSDPNETPAQMDGETVLQAVTSFCHFDVMQLLLSPGGGRQRQRYLHK